MATAMLEQAPRLTTGQLGARVRRLALSAHPEQAARRYEAAVEERRVMCLPNTDGTADLVACNLPAERAAACLRALNIEAHAAKRAGDSRSIDQLRTDILLDRLDVDRSTTRRRGVVDLHIDLTTLAGLDANPAEIPGFGPTSPMSPGKWRTANTTPSGGSTSPTRTGGPWFGMGPRAVDPPSPSAATWRHTTEAVCSPGAGCRQWTLTSTTPWTSAKGGATDVSNLGPLCRHHHRLKHEGERRLEQLEPGVFRWTSRLGHVYTGGPGPP